MSKVTYFDLINLFSEVASAAYELDMKTGYCRIFLGNNDIEKFKEQAKQGIEKEAWMNKKCEEIDKLTIEIQDSLTDDQWNTLCDYDEAVFSILQRFKPIRYEYQRILEKEKSIAILNAS